MKRIIYFCSFGFKLDHITLATIDVLKKVKTIFFAVDDKGLNEFIKKYDLDKKVKKRENTDHKILSKEIIKEVLLKKEVAVVSYGYPSFINGLWNLIYEKALHYKLELKVVHSVGSINPLMHISGFYEVPSDGLHIFNSPYLSSVINFNKHIPCFILNPHSKNPFLIEIVKNSLNRGLYLYFVEIENSAQNYDLLTEIKTLDDFNKKVNLRNTLLITNKKINKIS